MGKTENKDKVVNTACQKEVPIFPLRYSIKSKDEKTEINHAEIDYPKLEQLSYCTRLLRIGWVYLYDEMDGSFRVWETNNDGYFTELLRDNGKIEDINDEFYREDDFYYSDGLRTPYIVANAKSTKTYIGFSDVMWTERIFKAIKKSNDYGIKKSLMTKVNVKTWEEMSEVKHTFSIDELDVVSEEYMNEDWRTRFTWSSFMANKPNPSCENFYNSLINIPKGNGKAIGLKLYDNIGLVQEQTVLIGKAREILHNYVNENSHPKIVSDCIETFYEMGAMDGVLFDDSKQELKENMKEAYSEKYPNRLKQNNLETFRSEYFQDNASRYTDMIVENTYIPEGEEEEKEGRLDFLKEYNKKYKEYATALIHIKNDRHAHLKHFWEQSATPSHLGSSFENYDIKNKIAAGLHAQAFTMCIRGMMADPSVIEGIDNKEHKLFKDWWEAEESPVLTALLSSDDYIKHCHISKDIEENIKQMIEKEKEQTRVELKLLMVEDKSKINIDIVQWAFDNKTDVFADILASFGNIANLKLQGFAQANKIRATKREIETIINQASKRKIEKTKALGLLNNEKNQRVPAILLEEITVHIVKTRKRVGVRGITEKGYEARITELMGLRNKKSLDLLLKLLESSKYSDYIVERKITIEEFKGLFGDLMGIDYEKSKNFKLKKGVFSKGEVAIYMKATKEFSQILNEYDNIAKGEKLTIAKKNALLKKDRIAVLEIEKKIERLNTEMVEDKKLDKEQYLKLLEESKNGGFSPFVAKVENLVNSVGILFHLINLQHAYEAFDHDENILNNATYGVALVGTTAAILDTLEAFTRNGQPIGSKVAISANFVSLQAVTHVFGHFAATIDALPDAIKSVSAYMDGNNKAGTSFLVSALLWGIGGNFLRLAFSNPYLFLAVAIALGLAVFFSMLGSYLSYNAISKWLNACYFGQHDTNISKPYQSGTKYTDIEEEEEYAAFLRIIHEPNITEIEWEAMDLPSSFIGDWKDGRKLFLTVQLPIWKSLETIEWGIKFTDNPHDYAIGMNIKPKKDKGELIENKVDVFVPTATTHLSKLLEKYKYSPEIIKPFYDKEKNILILTVRHIPPPHLLANFMLSWYEPFNDSKIKVTHNYQLSYSMIDAFKKNYRKIEEKR